MSRKASVSVDTIRHPLPIGFHRDPTDPPAAVVDPPAADPPAAVADPPAGKSFTQADVDRLLARQKRVLVSGTEDDTFSVPADLKELRRKASEFDSLQEASKSELEKERDRAAKAEERATKIEAEAREIRVRAALVAEAAKPGRNIVDIDAAIALLDRDALDLDADGNPTNIASAMDSLLKAKPFLVASDGGADLGARDPGGIKQVTEAEYRAMTSEQKVEARKAGRLTGLGIGA